ncbi:MAG: hypothetical protein P4L87_20660 [Formivibrio sp.]|nr:hypothetical protein [Formivibrio sp.]
MQTTFDMPPTGAGRIAYLVYLIDGEKLPRKVTTGPDENANSAIERELVRIWGISVMDMIILKVGKQYQFAFADGNVKTVTVL